MTVIDELNSSSFGAVGLQLGLIVDGLFVGDAVDGTATIATQQNECITNLYILN
jgi:hypothetical protein